MRFMSIARILVVAVVGSMVLAACSAAPGAPASSGTSSADTKPYGSLTVAGRFGVGPLDPQAEAGQSFSSVSGAIFDSLYYYDPNNQLKPGIAEWWEISPDGTSHTYYIRKGVKFHDGSDLTGADVKFSLERQLAPASVVVDAPVWRALVSRVELKDDYTIVLHMKVPQFELPSGVNVDAMVSVVPKKYIEAKGVEYFQRNLVGSGPYKFVSYATGTRLELEAVESHWRQVPQFKRVTILSVPEEGAKVAMLKTGELDMASVAPDSVAALKSAGLRILSYDGGTQVFGTLFYDVEHPEKYALGDVRARKAMQLGISQREIADKILGGNGAPYAAFNVPPNAYFYDPSVLKPDPYDPEGAKKLLAESGYPNGFNTRINDVGAGGLLSTLSVAVSGYWRKIGVQAEVVPIDYSAFRPKMAARSPDIWNSYYIQVGTAPLHFEKMAIGYHSTKGFGKNIKNLELDELIDKVPQIADPNEKKRLALKAAVMAKNEYVHLSIVGMNLNIAASAKIGDVARYPGNDITKYMFETVTRPR